MLKNFEEKINNIRNEIYALGQSIIEANKICIEAVRDQNDELFAKAKATINSIDQKASNIDNMIVGALALHQPEAKDLREMVSFLKITNEIVRAGSSTKNFIRTFSLSLKSDVNIKSIIEYSIPLHKSSVLAFETAMEMININDSEKIEEYFHKTVVEESKTDDLYAIIEKDLLKLIGKDFELSRDYFDILRAVRRLEKVAGRALSIANLLVYAEIGGELNKV